MYTKMDGHASHLTEQLFLLLSNAHQLLNKAVREVPTQQIRYQQRLMERAPAGRKQRSIERKINKYAFWSQGDKVVAMETRTRIEKGTEHTEIK